MVKVKADTGRYGVVRYWDALGSWYGVVDKQHPSSFNNIVFATRSQKVAHRESDKRNNSNA